MVDRDVFHFSKTAGGAGGTVASISLAVVQHSTLEQGSSVHDFHRRIIAHQYEQVDCGIALGDVKDVCI
jgi:hypothetical protein